MPIAVSPVDGVLDTLILHGVNGSCMEICLQKVSARHARENIPMGLDGAGWHKNPALPLPDNFRLLFLPPYAPELNPVEHLWDDVREKSFHSCVFDSIDALEYHLEIALAAFEEDPQRAQSTTRWSWIINALSNELELGIGLGNPATKDKGWKQTSVLCFKAVPKLGLSPVISVWITYQW